MSFENINKQILLRSWKNFVPSLQRVFCMPYDYGYCLVYVSYVDVYGKQDIKNLVRTRHISSVLELYA